MSHQATTWAYKQDIKPSGAKFVLVTLANYATGEGYCFPGQDKLARDTGMSERAVRSHLTTLEAAGLIYRERRTNKHGHRTSDGYWLVGFCDLPEDIAADLAADSAGNQPADVSGRDESLPADSANPTGRFFQANRQNLPVHIRNVNRQYEPLEEPSVIAPAKPARKRDLLFEAIAEAWMRNPYSDIKLTKSQRGVINEAVNQLREIDASPFDVPHEWDKLRSKFDNPTPAALAKHWGTNGTGPKHERSSLDVVENYIAGIGRSGTGSNHRHGVDVMREAPQRERTQGLDSGLLELPDRGTGGDD